MATYTDFLQDYFKMRHFNNGMSLNTQKQLKDWVDSKNAEKEEIKTWEKSIYARITEDFVNKSDSKKISEQKKLIAALSEFKELGYLNGYIVKATNNPEEIEQMNNNLSELEKTINNLQQNPAVEEILDKDGNILINSIKKEINTFDGSARKAERLNEQIKRLALLQSNISQNLMTNYQEAYGKDSKDFRYQWLQKKIKSINNFSKNKSDFLNKDFTKEYININKFIYGLTDQSKSKDNMNPEELKDLYLDFWNVFDNLRKNITDPETPQNVVEFFNKYGTTIFPKKSNMTSQNQDTLAKWLTTVADEVKDYHGTATYSKIIQQLKKNKYGKVSTEVSDFLEYYNSTHPEDPKSAEFLKLIQNSNTPKDSNLQKFGTELPQILDTIYSKKDVAEAIRANGGDRIVSPMKEIRDENDFSKLPEKMKFPKSKFQKGKDKIKEKVLDDFLYKFSKRHYRHIYQNENAKSIVGALIKNQITPDKGLSVWLENSDKISSKLKPEQKKDWEKLKWFIEKLKKDDPQLFSKGLSSPDKLNFIAANIIKYTVSGQLSEGNAKAMLETFGVMRYGMFDFSGRKEKFKELWSDKTELVKGLSLFKGNKGAEAVGKVADWMAKLCFAGVVNAVALGRNLTKHLVAEVKQSGQKEINKLNKELTKELESNNVSDEDKKLLFKFQEELDKATKIKNDATKKLEESNKKSDKEISKKEKQIEDLDEKIEISNDTTNNLKTLIKNLDKGQIQAEKKSKEAKVKIKNIEKKSQAEKKNLKTLQEELKKAKKDKKPTKRIEKKIDNSHIKLKKLEKEKSKQIAIINDKSISKKLKSTKDKLTAETNKLENLKTKKTNASKEMDEQKKEKEQKQKDFDKIEKDYQKTLEKYTALKNDIMSKTNKAKETEKNSDLTKNLGTFGIIYPAKKRQAILHHLENLETCMFGKNNSNNKNKPLK